MSEYLGLGDFDMCEICGEQIRLLPHHCAQQDSSVDEPAGDVPSSQSLMEGSRDD